MTAQDETAPPATTRPHAAACIVAASLAFSAASIAVQFTPHGFLSNEDSWGPMQAALRLLAGPDHDRLYETVFFEQRTKFQYPPTSLLSLDLLDRLGAGTTRVLNGLNVVLTVASALCTMLLAERLVAAPLGLRGRGRLAAAVASALSTLAFYPVIRGLQLGQIQVWLNLCVAAACLLIAAGREASAGAIMGFAALVKPQLLPMGVVAVVSRRMRFAAGFAGVAVALGLVSLWRYGLHNHVEYLSVLSYIGRRGEAYFANNSVNGVLNRLMGNGSNLEWTGHTFPPVHPVVHALTILAAVAFLALPFLVRARPADRHGRLLHFSLATLCLVLASPIAWEHHFGVLPPVFVVTFAMLIEGGSGLASLLTLAAAWVLCASRLDQLANRTSDTLLNPLQATHLLGALLLLGVMTRTLRARTSARSDHHDRSVQSLDLLSELPQRELATDDATRV